MDLNRLTATEVATAIAGGRATALAVAEACLERIARREPDLHAFAHVDPDAVLDEARRRDRDGARGPLHGVPVAVKDIIDTADMPTQMGSAIYAGHRPRADAACVAILRQAGAVILGKTVTAEFASMSPGATVNPHNRAHTPGGSSSGSAAAVADFMAPVALGTQTGGSVLRPSAYCGIVGYKPTFGTFNLAGVKPAAQSLDTLGLHARSLDDIALVADVLVGRAPTPLALPARPPVIGLCRTPLWSHAEPETVTALADAEARLQAAGCRIAPIDLPDIFDGLDAARSAATAYERARGLAWEWTYHRDRLGAHLAEEIARGQAVTFEAYVAACKLAETCRRQIEPVLAGIDAVLAPATDGAAPLGIAATGNARFQGFWTILRLPSVTLPTHAAPNGLPVGIQLVGPAGADTRLLAIAKWALATLGAAPSQLP